MLRDVPAAVAAAPRSSRCDRALGAGGRQEPRAARRKRSSDRGSRDRPGVRPAGAEPRPGRAVARRSALSRADRTGGRPSSLAHRPGDTAQAGRPFRDLRSRHGATAPRTSASTGSTPPTTPRRARTATPAGPGLHRDDERRASSSRTGSRMGISVGTFRYPTALSAATPGRRLRQGHRRRRDLRLRRPGSRPGRPQPALVPGDGRRLRARRVPQLRRPGWPRCG